MAQRFKVQLYEMATNKLISDAGGTVYIAKTGRGQKEVLLTEAGASQTNPFVPTSGGFEFFVADTVVQVDMYVMCPGGQYIVAKNVKPGITPIFVDVNRRDWLALIPYSVLDSSAATEIDTLFDMPAKSLVLPHPSTTTLVLDAGITIEAGLKSGESGGDADGYIDVVSVATLGLAKATIANGANTLGALFEVQDSANAGDLTHEAQVITGLAAVSVTYTLLAGADTAEGTINLPYLLCG